MNLKKSSRLALLAIRSAVLEQCNHLCKKAYFNICANLWRRATRRRHTKTKTRRAKNRAKNDDDDDDDESDDDTDEIGEV